MTTRKIETRYAWLQRYSDISEGEVSTVFQGYPHAYVLIHSDEGVIWGRINAAGEVNLRSATVDQPRQDNLWQQIRVFNKNYEFHLWRDGDRKWQGRTISDSTEETEATFSYSLDENHLLWGNSAKDAGDSFTRLADVSQGLAHLVPLAFDDIDKYINQPEPHHYLALKVRHYLEALPDTGALRISASRLVDFDPSPKAENGASS